MLKKIVMLVCFSSVVFADWSFVDISYVNEAGKTVSVTSKEQIPECKQGKVRYACAPPPYLAFLVRPCICYTKCISKKKVKSLNWFERKKICLWWW